MGPAPIDTRVLKDCLAHYPTGVVAITAFDARGDAAAMIVGTFTSVSFDPPLVAFLPQKRSSSFARLREAGRFAVNILAHDQEAVVRRLARSDADKMRDVPWSTSRSGLPVLDDVVAVVECERRSVDEAGDHYIVIAEVSDVRVVNPTIPLLYFRGGYGGFAPSSIVMSGGGGELSEAVLQAQQLRDDLERTAERLGGELTVFARLGDDSVAVASATAAGAPQITALGTRYPLVPPIGVPLIAWSGDADQEAWVDRAIGSGEQERGDLRRHLEDAREAGWSVSLHESDDIDDPVLDGEGRAVEDTGRRDVWRRRILRAARYLDTADIRAGTRYDVGAVMAPIRGGEAGRGPALMVRSLLFPRATLNGDEIRAHAEELCAFAERSSLVLGERLAASGR